VIFDHNDDFTKEDQKLAEGDNHKA